MKTKKELELVGYYEKVTHTVWEKPFPNLNGKVLTMFDFEKVYRILED